MAWPWSLACARAFRSSSLTLILGAALLAPAMVRAQDTTAKVSTAARRHAPVCADGVRQYTSVATVPQPFDTLTLPKGPPIRVTSPDEERAAQRQMAERIGGIGATGMVTVEESHESDGGARMVRRHVIPVFVTADSARAQAACRDSVAGAKRMPDSGR